MPEEEEKEEEEKEKWVQVLLPEAIAEDLDLLAEISDDYENSTEVIIKAIEDFLKEEKELWEQVKRKKEEK